MNGDGRHTVLGLRVDINLLAITHRLAWNRPQKGDQEFKTMLLRVSGSTLFGGTTDLSILLVSLYTYFIICPQNVKLCVGSCQGKHYFWCTLLNMIDKDFFRNTLGEQCFLFIMSFHLCLKLLNQSLLASHKFWVSSLIKIAKIVLLHPDENESRFLHHPEWMRIFLVSSPLKCPW